MESDAGTEELEITESASEVIHRAHDAATRLNPEAKIRIFRMGDRVEAGFADQPHEGDEVREHEGLTIFIQNGISGTLDVSEEHDRLVVT